MKDIWMKCVWCYLWWRVSGLARSVLDCVSPVSARSPASTGRLTKDRLLILCNLQHQPALGGPTHVLILLMREGEAHTCPYTPDERRRGPRLHFIREGSSYFSEWASPSTWTPPTLTVFNGPFYAAPCP